METRNQHSDISLPKNFTLGYVSNRTLEVTGDTLRSLAFPKDSIVNINITSFEAPSINKYNLTFVPRLSNHLKQSAITLNWLIYLRENHTHDLDRSKIREINLGLQNLMQEERFSELDQILSKTLNESSSIDSIICLLRTTFTAKQSLNNWYNLLADAKTWISSKGKDYQKILVGLV